MEDSKNQPPKPQTSTGQVMDIQPPRAGSDFKPAVAAAPVEAPPHIDESISPDDSNQPEASEVPATENTGSLQSPEAVNPLAIPARPAPPSKDHKLLLITTALIVSATLAGISIFVYIQSNNKTDLQPVAGTTEQQTEDTAVQDIDAAESEIDEALKSSDEAEFAENDLSDKSLEL